MSDEKESSRQRTVPAPNQPVVAGGTEWYKKRRDQVPTINLTGLKKNPFMHLLKTNKENSADVNEAS